MDSYYTAQLIIRVDINKYSTIDYKISFVMFIITFIQIVVLIFVKYYIFYYVHL